jgi:hypothetical protein
VGDPWLSIMLTLCQILHSVSHWPVLVYLINTRCTTAQLECCKSPLKQDCRTLAVEGWCALPAFVLSLMSHMLAIRLLLRLQNV